MQFHGILHTRPFKTPLQPYSTYYALFIVSLLALTNGYAVFFPGQFTASGFLVSYVGFAIFIVLYIGHKAWYRTPWMVKISEVDIFSGKDEMDRLCEDDVERLPRNWLEKIWFWIA